MTNFDPDKEIKARYCSYIDDTINFRLRIIGIVGSVLILVFNILDRIAYPAYALVFLKIRLCCSLIFFLVFLLSFYKKIKQFAIWLGDFLIIFSAACIILMIYLSDGSSSHYYEGLHIVILGMLIMNSFYLRHSIICALAILAMYQFAVFANHQVFNQSNFYSANFFMISIDFLVILFSTQHRQAFLRQEQLDQLSKTDELTKTHNRRSFFDLLQNKIETSEKLHNYFYLAIFDVDHFKELNDKYGHSFGDLALTKVIEIVRKNIRNHDCLGRFGGDEFVLFLDIPDADMLMRRLTKISQEVTGLNLKQNNQSVLVSISIGAARFVPGLKMTADELLEMADQQLLVIKKTNRGQIGIAE